MEQPKILVTGAAGLIGKAVFETLIEKGYSVTGVDNLSRPGSKNKEYLINDDLLNFYRNQKNNFDIIFHFAAINGTDAFYDIPNQIIENNIQLDLATFEFAKSNNSKIVYASSSEVIAGSNTVPTPEEKSIFISNIHNPRWSYRLCKILSENYLTNSEHDYLIVRFFNVFGEDSRKGHFLHDIIEKIKNKDYNLIGYNETRSFCYIDDAIDALLSVAFSENQTVINIGNDEEISILDAASVISNSIFNINTDWILQKGRLGSTARRCPDVTKIKEILADYKPLSFREAIEKIKDTNKNEKNNIKN